MPNHQSGPPGQRARRLVLRKIQQSEHSQSGPLPRVTPPPRRDSAAPSEAPPAPMRARLATLEGLAPLPLPLPSRPKVDPAALGALAAPAVPQAQMTPPPPPPARPTMSAVAALASLDARAIPHADLTPPAPHAPAPPPAGPPAPPAKPAADAAAAGVAQPRAGAPGMSLPPVVASVPTAATVTRRASEPPLPWLRRPVTAATGIVLAGALVAAGVVLGQRLPRPVPASAAPAASAQPIPELPEAPPAPGQPPPETPGPPPAPAQPAQALQPAQSAMLPDPVSPAPTTEPTARPWGPSADTQRGAGIATRTISVVPVGPVGSAAAPPPTTPPAASVAGGVAAPVERPEPLVPDFPPASPPPVDPLVRAVQQDIAEEEGRRRR
jgi:hypothetical protein